MNMYRTTVFPVVPYGRESWSLRLLDEHELRMFENSIWEICLGLKRLSYEESGEDYITRSFTICTPHQIKSKKNETSEACSTYGDRKCGYRVL